MAKYISNKLFYEQSYKRYGFNAKGLHWKNQQTQYKRFEIITQLIEKDLKNSTIGDLGCGFGDYYKYLKERNLEPKSYHGIDCELKMVQVCKSRYKDIAFEHKNILYEDFSKSDYNICSGAMNIMNIDQCSLFIKRAFKHSKKGFIFNFLQSITLNDVKPYEIVALCEKLCPKIEFKEGYLDNDFTIFMAK